ncbi:hypothetical protein CBM2587_B60140 [Cupriavidus taiwanensis]|uniref:Uncharacterized protein n=1 Tax=Cupriavidus taiwanensis TaxID=164546 RepID=A0A975X9P5_9BURK|nr:hypothetical protein CBM2587_B60140 [Cupriavidus taiwanensis]
MPVSFRRSRASHSTLNDALISLNIFLAAVRMSAMTT